MQEKKRHYEFEGVVLDMPMHYDELTGKYIENYRNFNEEPAWTKDGHPVIGAVEEGCSYGEWDKPARCNECGSCRYYTPLNPDALIGVCRHAKRLWAGKTM